VRRRHGRGRLARRLWRLVAGRPNDNSVAIFLAHNMIELDQFAKKAWPQRLCAITRFQALLRQVAA